MHSSVSLGFGHCIILAAEPAATPEKVPGGSDRSMGDRAPSRGQATAETACFCRPRGMVGPETASAPGKQRISA